MRINHNISSMITQNSLYQVSQSMAQSLQKLSTGLSINSAADDAAGLGVSENLRTQVNGLGQATKNTQAAISMLNIADGALNEQSNILQRMRELVVQGLNDTYSSTERTYMGQEFSGLRDELDRIAASTNYNGMQIFAAPQETVGTPVYNASATAGSAPREDVSEATEVNPTDPLFGADDMTSGNHFNMLIGANYNATDAAALNAGNNWYSNAAPDMITIQFGQMDSNGLLAAVPQNVNGQASQIFDGFSWDPVNDAQDHGIAIGAFLDGDAASVNTATVQNKLNLLLKVIDGTGGIGTNTLRFGLHGTAGNTYVTGIARVNEMRARIGATTNTLQHSVNNSMNGMNNTQAAESQIRDVDFASETAKYTRNQILTQSATAMLAQANTLPQGVLQLLK